MYFILFTVIENHISILWGCNENYIYGKTKNGIDIRYDLQTGKILAYAKHMETTIADAKNISFQHLYQLHDGIELIANMNLRGITRFLIIIQDIQKRPP